MPEAHFLQDMLVLFGLGIVAVVVFHRANLPPVLGFLLTGILCGPYGFKLVDSIHQVEVLAELGVVLLLFTIGIEFSFARLKQMKKFLLLGGGLQVGLTVAVTAAVTAFVGLPLNTAVFIGMLVSLSSTVIVIKLLDDKNTLYSPHGSNALSVLIFQDLCIVPMVLIAPFLSGEGGDIMQLGWMLGKAIVLVVVAVAIARYMIPWLLDHVANTRKREAFVLSVMLLCLGTGWATSQVGMSMALGAFLAGLVISESRYNHQALSEILPFREVFNFLVFVSIGMLLDVRILLQEPLLITGCLVALILIKTLVLGGVTFSFGHSLKVALLTGFTLAQVSEFSFVLSKLGLELKIFDNSLNQIFLAVGILSMALTPAICAAAGPIATWVSKLFPERWTSGRNSELPHEQEALNEHVIIAGFGPTGRTLATVLDRTSIPYIVVDTDPQVVATAQDDGVPIFYGDAASESVLQHAGIDHARLVAVTTLDMDIAVRAVALARRMNPAVHVIARARSSEDVKELQKAGAHDVSAEEFMGSIDMFTQVLQNYLVAQEVIADRVQEVRTDWSQSCKRLYEMHRPGESMSYIPGNMRVEVQIVQKGSPLVGLSLLDSQIRRKTGITVVLIEREDSSILKSPGAADVFREGDHVVLLGREEQLLAAAPFFHKAE